MSQADLPLQPLRGAVASRSRRAPSPLGAAFAVVYVSLASLVLVDPQPVLDWLDDLDPSPAVSAARAAVETAAAASGALGLPSLSSAVRSRTVALFKRAEIRPSREPPPAEPPAGPAAGPGAGR